MMKDDDGGLFRSSEAVIIAHQTSGWMAQTKKFRRFAIWPNASSKIFILKRGNWKKKKNVGLIGCCCIALTGNNQRHRLLWVDKWRQRMRQLPFGWQLTLCRRRRHRRRCCCFNADALPIDVSLSCLSFVCIWFLNVRQRRHCCPLLTLALVDRNLQSADGFIFSRFPPGFVVFVFSCRPFVCLLALKKRRKREQSVTFPSDNQTAQKLFLYFSSFFCPAERKRDWCQNTDVPLLFSFLIFPFKK